MAVDVSRASGGTRNRFRFAYLAVALAALALTATAVYWPEPSSPNARAHQISRDHRHIPSRIWGHAASYDGAMFVTLGPAADRRRKYELSFDRVEFSAAAISISNDRGRTFHALQGEPMGRCGYHWQGYGINAIVATHECVPGWARDKAGAHAPEWMRIENLVPFARFVVVRYDPAPRGGGLLTAAGA